MRSILMAFVLVILVFVTRAQPRSRAKHLRKPWASRDSGVKPLAEQRYKRHGFESAAPWTAPPGTRFPYQGLEKSLEDLLKVQASPNRWISIITMSEKIKRFVLNCIYSLQKYGHWSHFILVTFDDESLSSCKQLNLPCYDGSPYASVRIHNGEHGYASGNATEIWWAKQRLATDLLRSGYNVHGSDADVVYLRRLNESYHGLFQKSGADGIFASEEWAKDMQADAPGGQRYLFLNYINAGVYAVKSNPRSLHFFRSWTANTSGGTGGIDQVKLNNLYLKEYLFCDSKITCASVQRIPKFSIFRHKSFYPNGYCIEDTLRPKPCDTRRMYLHHLCAGGHGWAGKTVRWNKLNVWFIDEQLQPMFSDGGGTGGRHPFLPCKEKVAWPELESIPLQAKHEQRLFP